MKKLHLSLVIFLFAVFCLYSQKIRLGIGNADFPYIEYQIDTIAGFQVGPGTYYLALRLTSVVETDPPIHQNVFFLKADLRNPHLELRQVLGRDSLYGLERPTLKARRKSTPGNFFFAGINGDFFDRNGRPISGN
ncbi:MAG: hypothetical protein FWC34_00430, partial [Bacteroidetes bacterium]|nr:hypothetical protein [Bacteroidota bacterium]